eukprot:677686-Pyramimonas_sp.AAC.1
MTMRMEAHGKSDTSKVGQDTSCGYRVLCRKVGLTKTEFEAEYKKSPDEYGLRLQDLVSPSGKQYKGVLKNWEGETGGYLYEFYRDVVTSRTNYVCHASHNIHAEQGAAAFKRTAESELKKGMLQKLKCCNLDKASILARLDRAVDGGGPGGDEWLAEGSDGDDDLDEDGESDGENVQDLDGDVGGGGGGAPSSREKDHWRQQNHPNADT